MSKHYKGDRILSLYLRMADGKEVQKLNYCQEESITARSFDRDIQTLRNCLSEHYLGEEIIYDKAGNCYYLQSAPKPKEITNTEIYLLLKMLLHDRVLRDDEAAGLSDVLISMARPTEQAELREIFRSEIARYEPPQHGQAIMKILGDLLLMIRQRRKIQLEYHIGKHAQRVIVCPLALEYSDNVIFLSAAMEQDGTRRGVLFDISGIHSFLPLSTYYTFDDPMQRLQGKISDSIRQGMSKKYKY